VFGSQQIRTCRFQRRGLKFGRKVKLTTEQINHARKLTDKGEARQYVADLLNVGRSTLYRALRF
jgi:DNA invertase Pin-like site-specific DNA recombinase